MIDEEISLRCPRCEKENPHVDWDDTTICAFGADVTLIGEEGWQDCCFVCPSCSEEVMGCDFETEEDATCQNFVFWLSNHHL